MRTRFGVPVLLAAAVLLSGCRIDVGTEVAFGRGGGGEVAVSVRIDGATLRELDRAGVDPGLDVDLGLGGAPGHGRADGSAWTARRSVDADGGLVLTYRRAFVDGAGATALLRELWEDVEEQDPALRLDVEVTTTPSGAVSLAGTAALRPPATLGVRIDGRPVGAVDAELAALVADAVRADLVVRVPGRVVEHDADAELDGTLRWVLPVGEPRPVTLVAAAPPLWRRVPPAAALAAGVLIAAAGTALVRRRRVEDEDGAGISPAG